MNAALVMALALGLVSVIVSTLVPPVPMVAGVKLFATPVVVSTVRLALAAAVLAPALVVASAPMAIELL